MKKKAIFYILLITLCVALGRHLNNFLKIDTCLDGGEVWDYDEHRCRADCLTWTDTNGCILLDEEYLPIFEKCSQTPKSCPHEKERKLYFKLCEKYNAPVNLDTGLCDFKFTAEKCHKLKGNWKYPKICYP